MTTHVNFIENFVGDLVDIEWFCSQSCYEIHTGNNALMPPAAYPCGEETDYDVYCEHCGALMWKGLNSDD